MPIIKSAKKRVKVAQKATIRNVKTKRNLKNALKSFQAALTSGKDVSKAHQEAQSALDTAAKKNVLHKNKVARKKSQLAKQAKETGTKPAATAKKASTSKSTAGKTSTAKKTAAKKPSAKKKPAAKKTAKK